MKVKDEVKDEFRLHLYYLSKLIVKYPKILVYGYYGEGKSTLFKSLKLKYPAVNFYSNSQNDIEEPFVYVINTPDDPFIPNFDRIYCIQYSTEYKEKTTGVSFPRGEWRPMADYVEKAELIKQNKINLSGKIFGSLAELKKAIEEE